MPGAAGHWLPYVVVDDLDQATKRAVSLGATVVSQASDGPAGVTAMPGEARPRADRVWPAEATERG